MTPDFHIVFNDFVIDTPVTYHINGARINGIELVCTVNRKYYFLIFLEEYLIESGDVTITTLGIFLLYFLEILKNF